MQELFKKNCDGLNVPGERELTEEELSEENKDLEFDPFIEEQTDLKITYYSHDFQEGSTSI